MSLAQPPQLSPQPLSLRPSESKDSSPPVADQLSQMMLPLPPSLDLKGDGPKNAMVKNLIAMLWSETAAYRIFSFTRSSPGYTERELNKKIQAEKAKDTSIPEMKVFIAEMKEAVKVKAYADAMAYIEDPIIFHMLRLNHVVLKLLELDKDNKVFQKVKQKLFDLDVLVGRFFQSHYSAEELKRTAEQLKRNVGVGTVIGSKKKSMSKTEDDFNKLPSDPSYNDLESLARKSEREDVGARAKTLQEAFARLSVLQAQVVEEVTKIAATEAKTSEDLAKKAKAEAKAAEAKTAEAKIVVEETRLQQLNVIQSLLAEWHINGNEYRTAPPSLQLDFLGIDSTAAPIPNNMHILARAASFSAVTTSDLLDMLKKLQNIFTAYQEMSKQVKASHGFFEWASEEKERQNIEKAFYGQMSAALMDFVAIKCQLHFRVREWNARKSYDRNLTVPHFSPIPPALNLTRTLEDEKRNIEPSPLIVTPALVNGWQDIFNETMTDELVAQVQTALATTPPEVSQTLQQVANDGTPNAQLFSDHLEQLRQANARLAYNIPAQWRSLFWDNKNNPEFQCLAAKGSVWILLTQMQDFQGQDFSHDSVEDNSQRVRQLLYKRGVAVQQLIEMANKNRKLRAISAAIIEKLSLDPNVQRCASVNSPFFNNYTLGELLREKFIKPSQSLAKNNAGREFLGYLRANAEDREFSEKMAVSLDVFGIEAMVVLDAQAANCGLLVDAPSALQGSLFQAFTTWVGGEPKPTLAQIIETLSAIDKNRMLGDSEYTQLIREYFKQLRLFCEGSPNCDVRLVTRFFAEAPATPPALSSKQFLEKIVLAKLKAAVAPGANVQDEFVAPTMLQTYSGIIAGSHDPELIMIFKLYTAKTLAMRFPGFLRGKVETWLKALSEAKEAQPIPASTLAVYMAVIKGDAGLQKQFDTVKGKFTETKDDASGFSVNGILIKTAISVFGQAAQTRDELLKAAQIVPIVHTEAKTGVETSGTIIGQVIHKGEEELKAPQSAAVARMEVKTEQPITSPGELMARLVSLYEGLTLLKSNAALLGLDRSIQTTAATDALQPPLINDNFNAEYKTTQEAIEKVFAGICQSLPAVPVPDSTVAIPIKDEDSDVILNSPTLLLPQEQKVGYVKFVLQQVLQRIKNQGKAFALYDESGNSLFARVLVVARDLQDPLVLQARADIFAVIKEHAPLSQGLRDVVIGLYGSGPAKKLICDMDRVQLDSAVLELEGQLHRQKGESKKTAKPSIGMQRQVGAILQELTASGNYEQFLTIKDALSRYSNRLATLALEDYYERNKAANTSASSLLEVCSQWFSNELVLDQATGAGANISAACRYIFKVSIARVLLERNDLMSILLRRERNGEEDLSWLAESFRALKLQTKKTDKNTLKRIDVILMQIQQATALAKLKQLVKAGKFEDLYNRNFGAATFADIQKILGRDYFDRFMLFLEATLWETINKLKDGSLDAAGRQKALSLFRYCFDVTQDAPQVQDKVGAVAIRDMLKRLFGFERIDSQEAALNHALNISTGHAAKLSVARIKANRQRDLLFRNLEQQVQAYLANLASYASPISFIGNHRAASKIAKAIRERFLPNIATGQAGSIEALLNYLKTEVNEEKIGNWNKPPRVRTHTEEFLPALEIAIQQLEEIEAARVKEEAALASDTSLAKHFQDLRAEFSAREQAAEAATKHEEAPVKKDESKGAATEAKTEVKVAAASAPAMAPVAEEKKEGQPSAKVEEKDKAEVKAAAVETVEDATKRGGFVLQRMNSKMLESKEGKLFEGGGLEVKVGEALNGLANWVNQEMALLLQATETNPGRNNFEYVQQQLAGLAELIQDTIASIREKIVKSKGGNREQIESLLAAFENEAFSLLHPTANQKALLRLIIRSKLDVVRAEWQKALKTNEPETLRRSLRSIESVRGFKETLLRDLLGVAPNADIKTILPTLSPEDRQLLADIDAITTEKDAVLKESRVVAETKRRLDFEQTETNEIKTKLAAMSELQVRAFVPLLDEQIRSFHELDSVAESVDREISAADASANNLVRMIIYYRRLHEVGKKSRAQSGDNAVSDVYSVLEKATYPYGLLEQTISGYLNGSISVDRVARVVKVFRQEIGKVAIANADFNHTLEKILRNCLLRVSNQRVHDLARLFIDKYEFSEERILQMVVESHGAAIKQIKSILQSATREQNQIQTINMLMLTISNLRANLALLKGDQRSQEQHDVEMAYGEVLNSLCHDAMRQIMLAFKNQLNEPEQLQSTINVWMRQFQTLRGFARTAGDQNMVDGTLRKTINAIIRANPAGFAAGQPALMMQQVINKAKEAGAQIPPMNSAYTLWMIHNQSRLSTILLAESKVSEADRLNQLKVLLASFKKAATDAGLEPQEKRELFKTILQGCYGGQERKAILRGDFGGQESLLQQMMEDLGEAVSGLRYLDASDGRLGVAVNWFMHDLFEEGWSLTNVVGGFKPLAKLLDEEEQLAKQWDETEENISKLRADSKDTKSESEKLSKIQTELKHIRVTIQTELEPARTIPLPGHVLKVLKLLEGMLPTQLNSATDVNYRNAVISQALSLVDAVEKSHQRGLITDTTLRDVYDYMVRSLGNRLFSVDYLKGFGSSEGAAAAFLADLREGASRSQTPIKIDVMARIAPSLAAMEKQQFTDHKEIKIEPNHEFAQILDQLGAFLSDNRLIQNPQYRRNVIDQLKLIQLSILNTVLSEQSQNDLCNFIRLIFEQKLFGVDFQVLCENSAEKATKLFFQVLQRPAELAKYANEINGKIVQEVLTDFTNITRLEGLLDEQQRSLALKRAELKAGDLETKIQEHVDKLKQLEKEGTEALGQQALTSLLGEGASSGVDLADIRERYNVVNAELIALQEEKKKGLAISSIQQQDLQKEAKYLEHNCELLEAEIKKQSTLCGNLAIYNTIFERLKAAVPQLSSDEDIALKVVVIQQLQLLVDKILQFKQVLPVGSANQILASMYEKFHGGNDLFAHRYASVDDFVAAVRDCDIDKYSAQEKAKLVARRAVYDIAAPQVAGEPTEVSSVRVEEKKDVAVVPPPSPIAVPLPQSPQPLHSATPPQVSGSKFAQLFGEAGVAVPALTPIVSSAPTRLPGVTSLAESVLEEQRIKLPPEPPRQAPITLRANNPQDVVDFKTFWDSKERKGEEKVRAWLESVEDCTVGIFQDDNLRIQCYRTMLGVRRILGAQNVNNAEQWVRWIFEHQRDVGLCADLYNWLGVIRTYAPGNAAARETLRRGYVDAYYHRLIRALAELPAIRSEADDKERATAMNANAKVIHEFIDKHFKGAVSESKEKENKERKEAVSPAASRVTHYGILQPLQPAIPESGHKRISRHANSVLGRLDSGDRDLASTTWYDDEDLAFMLSKAVPNYNPGTQRVGETNFYIAPPIDYFRNPYSNALIAEVINNIILDRNNDHPPRVGAFKLEIYMSDHSHWTNLSLTINPANHTITCRFADDYAWHATEAQRAEALLKMQDLVQQVGGGYALALEATDGVRAHDGVRLNSSQHDGFNCGGHAFGNVLRRLMAVDANQVTLAYRNVFPNDVVSDADANHLRTQVFADFDAAVQALAPAAPVAVQGRISAEPSSSHVESVSDSLRRSSVSVSGQQNPPSPLSQTRSVAPSVSVSSTGTDSDSPSPVSRSRTVSTSPEGGLEAVLRFLGNIPPRESFSGSAAPWSVRNVIEPFIKFVRDDHQGQTLEEIYTRFSLNNVQYAATLEFFHDATKLDAATKKAMQELIRNINPEIKDTEIAGITTIDAFLKLPCIAGIKPAHKQQLFFAALTSLIAANATSSEQKDLSEYQELMRVFTHLVQHPDAKDGGIKNLFTTAAAIKQFLAKINTNFDVLSGVQGGFNGDFIPSIAALVASAPFTDGAINCLKNLLQACKQTCREGSNDYRYLAAIQTAMAVESANITFDALLTKVSGALQDRAVAQNFEIVRQVFGKINLRRTEEVISMPAPSAVHTTVDSAVEKLSASVSVPVLVQQQVESPKTPPVLASQPLPPPSIPPGPKPLSRAHRVVVTPTTHRKA